MYTILVRLETYPLWIKGDEASTVRQTRFTQLGEFAKSFNSTPKYRRGGEILAFLGCIGKANEKVGTLR